MLGFSRVMKDCEGLHRRDLLRIGALTGLGITLPNLLAQRSRAASGGRKDVNCILIWSHGGTSHHDTFDPKPKAPLSVRGEFNAIDTAVPGVQFTEIMPRMAKELKRFALLRSWNPENGSHGTADQWVMSGKRFNPSVTHPCYGSVVSYERGFKSSMPPFVQLGSNIDRRFGGGTSGYLGLEHMPFEMLADPNQDPFVVRDITPPAGVSSARIDSRRRMLNTIESLQRQAELQPAAFDATDEQYKAALNMITATSTKQAFEIHREDPRLRDRYGRTRFGQNLLLSRRLIESGVRFVTVTDPGWDTHAGNFVSLKTRLIPPLDQGIPELLIDLEERGLLDSTLVIWVTDFGRTPKINSASGRDHWASAGFAVMAGVGIPGGAVLGATDDEGGVPTRDQYVSADIAATVYTKLGIPLDTVHTAPDGRPMRLVDGRPIKEWC